MICRKLRLKPGETLLDIGCGWGALSCYAAQHYGVTRHGVTLSEQQVAYAQEKIKRLGLEDRVTIELKDYSTVEGQFDKVAAIGMPGACRHRTTTRPIIATIKRRAEAATGFYPPPRHHPAGQAHRQGASARSGRSSRSLTRYIFPGGELDHIGIHGRESRAQRLRGPRRRGLARALPAHLPALARPAARRTTTRPSARSARSRRGCGSLYLAGCSIAFERSGVGLYQTLSKRRKRGPSGLPPTRADLYR